ncbi:hypothetical protein AMTR_s00063p00014550 [Amborella trichopoda]|uniref:Glutaredoxin domain-containing protein n=2 Tax=Amborella trichopoda TaxID=13333 RepID=U5D1V6_AMBTC|nr:hypothetical protein AMTR_s00063p00014550 [Amborella trichopoda]
MAPVNRSMSMPLPGPVHHPPSKKGESYHLVSLTSTTYGSLVMDSLSQFSPQSPNKSTPQSVNTLKLMEGIEDHSFATNGQTKRREELEWNSELDRSKFWENFDLQIAKKAQIKEELEKDRNFQSETQKFCQNSNVPLSKQSPSRISTRPLWMHLTEESLIEEMDPSVASSLMLAAARNNRTTHKVLNQSQSFSAISRGKLETEHDSKEFSSMKWSPLHKDSMAFPKVSPLQTDPSALCSLMASPLRSDLKAQLGSEASPLWDDPKTILGSKVSPLGTEPISFSSLKVSSLEKDPKAHSSSKILPLDKDLKTLKPPPSGDNKIVFYFTSLRGIRKTYEDCCAVRMILRGFRVSVDERDVSMDSAYRKELQSIFGASVALPQLFIRGEYVGGAEEVRALHEIGELSRYIEGIPLQDPALVCEMCGDARFVLCDDCHGSRKLCFDDGKLYRCPNCNENGLVRCPKCCF